MLHAHITTASRDCDGRYSGGHDVQANDGEDAYDFKRRLFQGLYTEPDPYGGPVSVVVDDDRDRLTMHMSRTTDEGFESTTIAVCGRDDYDPDYNGYRDHTAERMGY